MSDIRLVNVVPIVNEWNDAAKKIWMRPKP